MSEHERLYQQPFHLTLTRHTTLHVGEPNQYAVTYAGEHRYMVLSGHTGVEVNAQNLR